MKTSSTSRSSFISCPRSFLVKTVEIWQQQLHKTHKHFQSNYKKLLFVDKCSSVSKNKDSFSRPPTHHVLKILICACICFGGSLTHSNEDTHTHTHTHRMAVAQVLDASSTHQKAAGLMPCTYILKCHWVRY